MWAGICYLVWELIADAFDDDKIQFCHGSLEGTVIAVFKGFQFRQLKRIFGAYLLKRGRIGIRLLCLISFSVSGDFRKLYEIAFLLHS